MAVQFNLRTHFSLLQKSLSRCYATKIKARKPISSIESLGSSLAAKGFLRPNKHYTAPENAAERVRTICASLQIPSTDDHKLINVQDKFSLLEACFKDFQHSVPNSQIHELESIGDVIGFYVNSVDTTIPYDALKKMDLPENLHIQYDYVRFQPETDTKFNGKTAYPKSSTLVTGVKYRGKYDGHEAKRSWP